MTKKTAMTIILVIAFGCVFLGPSWAAAADTIELKFATAFSPKHTMQRMVFEPWGKKISELTNGKVKVTFFPGGALGKAPDHYALAEKGIADIVYTLHDYTPGRFPLTTVFELPFMAQDAATLSEAMWKTYEKFPEFQKEYRKVKVLALFAHPPGHFYTTEKPIRSITDFKGLKFRTASPFVTKALKAFGAAPVSMPVTEAYTALERGVVDGTVVPWEGVFIFKLGELIKYCTEADFYTMTMTVLMNKRKWESLPKDVQKVIEENSGLSMSLACGRTFDKVENPLKKKVVDQGVEVLQLSASDKGKLEAMAAPLREEWVKEMKGKGLPGQAVLDAAVQLCK